MCPVLGLALLRDRGWVHGRHFGRSTTRVTCHFLCVTPAACPIVRDAAAPHRSSGDGTEMPRKHPTGLSVHGHKTGSHTGHGQVVPFRFCLLLYRRHTPLAFVSLWTSGLGFCVFVGATRIHHQCCSDSNVRPTCGPMVLEALCCFLAPNIPGLVSAFPAPAWGSAVCPRILGSLY